MSAKRMYKQIRRRCVKGEKGPQNNKCHEIAMKHDDVRDHNKPGARCIAGELRGPAVEADGKQAVRNAIAVVY